MKDEFFIPFAFSLHPWFAAALLRELGGDMDLRVLGYNYLVFFSSVLAFASVLVLASPLALPESLTSTLDAVILY